MNTILASMDPAVRKEATALAAIKPGHLVERATGGIQVCATAAGAGAPAVALESGLLGVGVDGAYAAGDPVPYAFPPRGAEVQMRVAASVSVADNAYLERAADGTVRTYTNGVIIGRAREAVTGVADVVAFILVEVM